MNYKNKPFCKVCFDAGKTDTAHFIRSSPDPKSHVICPTLLAIQCRYCSLTGHTVKYCPALNNNNNKDNKDKDNNNNKDNNKDKHKDKDKQPFRNHNNTTTHNKHYNMFAILNTDTDSDDDDTTQHDKTYQYYGEILYQKIYIHYPRLAPKIVGMLLEIEDIHLERMIYDNQMLYHNVYDAVQILQICNYIP